MDDTSLPRSLSWTSLLILTLLAALAEYAILFPDGVVSTRLAAALSWEAGHRDRAPPRPRAAATAPRRPLRGGRGPRPRPRRRRPPARRPRPAAKRGSSAGA